MAVGSIQGVAAPVSAVPSPTQTKSKVTTAYDPADTNQDGVVSPEEAVAYALAHPEVALQKALLSSQAAYSANGAATPSAQGSQGLLDLRI